MDKDSKLDPSDDRFEEWIQNYHSEGDLIRNAIIDSVNQALALEDIGATRRFLRKARELPKNNFCLLLYGSETDEDIANELYDQLGEKIGLEKEEFANSVDAVSQRSNSKIMTVLMMLAYEQAGMHLVMIQRETDTPLEGPIRFHPPDPLWFDTFRTLAELAQAIIVITNVRKNLIEELFYLADAGLQYRVLMYHDFKVSLSHPNTPLEEQKTWEIRNGLVDAIEYVAGQPAGSDY